MKRYTNKTKLKIIEDATSAIIFKILSDAVKEHVLKTVKPNELESPQTLTKPPDAVVLMLGFTLDGTQSNSGTFHMTPVNFYCLNLIDDEFKMNTIGLAPSNRLPYNEKEMHKILSNTIITKKVKTKKTITIKAPSGKSSMTKKLMKHYKLKFQRDFTEAFKITT